MLVVTNYVLAWFSALLSILLSVKYIVRKLAGSKLKIKTTFQKWNRLMREWHIPIGVAMLATGLVHGLLSSESIFSLNFGTVTWIVGLLIGLSYIARKLYTKKNTWLQIHRILTVVFLALIVIHVVDVGGINIFRIMSGGYKSHGGIVRNGSNNPADTMYRDGVYTGVVTGYRDGLTVEVTVSEGRITDIAVTSHNEVGARFFVPAMQEIPQRIINAQTLDVDAVSGATYTSIGIINAVDDALSKAVK